MPGLRFPILLCFAMIQVCGCTRKAPLSAASGVEFDPIAFFKGHTHGEGDLRKLFSEPAHVSVDSIGRISGDGLVLDQTLREASKPTSSRRWTIRRVSANQYTGTLTEAVGPVTARVVGPRAFIAYKMRHGFNVEQELALQSDGTTVLNRLVVRKFGAPVATLHETIRTISP